MGSTSATATAANMQAALDEAGKVVKKQRLCAAKVGDAMQQLLDAATAARGAVASGTTTAQAAIGQLQAQVEQLGLVRDMNSSTKDLHSAINKLSKALDKAVDMQQDICRGMRDWQFDQQLLNKVIAEHLYREGRFELADQFVAEAALPGGPELKATYVALHTVLQEIKRQKLAPALEWAQQHRAALSQDGSPSGFEFRLHEAAFLTTLSTAGQGAALAYARQHFGAFKGRHLQDIQRLMGCLLFADRPAEETPYADLLSPARWAELAQEFARQACSLMGRAYDSPLAVTLAAGAVALPPLLKLLGVMEKGGQDLRSCGQLPLEIELGAEFVFHSIFACPVGRDQSTPDNPPKLLPCNHVLCEQSIAKIARSRSRVLKCPYCPMEARPDNTRTLIFPDVE